MILVLLISLMVSASVLRHETFKFLMTYKNIQLLIKEHIKYNKYNRLTENVFSHPTPIENVIFLISSGYI